MSVMTYYGAKQLADSFRTVRDNTIKIAEEIPEDKYSFRVTPDTRSVAETLIHIAQIPAISYQIHGVEKRDTMAGFDFFGLRAKHIAEEKAPHTKAEILKKLAEGRDQFANWLASLSEEFLAQSVAMPPGGSPPSRGRFDMLLAVKEHEMHHRAQLMIMQRMMGIVPHLTRQFEEIRARMMQQSQSATS